MERLFHKVFPINALPAARLAGAGIDELSHDGELKSRAVVRYYREVPADLMFFFSDIAIQAEAMGAGVAFGPASMPTVVSPAPVAQTPRAADFPRMAVNARVLRNLGREFPGRLRSTMVYGPFTVAGQVAGEREVLRGTVDRPGEVKDLLEKCLAVAMDYARLLLEAGADVLWVSDPLAALLPPDAFPAFAGDFLARLFAVRGGRDTALHICGDTSQIIKGMLDTGVGGISFDQCLNLAALEDRVPRDTAIIGNINPVETLDLAPAADAARESAELAHCLGPAPNFVLSSGCAPPPGAPVENIRAFVQAGREALARVAPHREGLFALADLVLEGGEEGVAEGCRALLEAGAPPLLVIRSGLMRAVKTASALYEAKRLFLPSILMMVDSFYRGYRVLEPLLTGAQGPPQVVLGTVRGDIHEIGKNLVALILEAHGIRVLDLGVNVPADDFARAVREHGAPVVGLSAFITTVRGELARVREALEEAGLSDTEVIIGGAAANTQVAEWAGARGYAADAVAAVKLVEEILKEKGRLKAEA